MHQTEIELELVYHHALVLVCISKPFVALSVIHHSFWRSLSFFPVVLLIGVPWSPICGFSVFKICWCRLFNSASSQKLTISCTLDFVSCVGFLVYAMINYIERRRVLLEELKTISSSHSHTPWIAFGNLNCVLDAHEKKEAFSLAVFLARNFKLCLLHVVCFTFQQKVSLSLWYDEAYDGRLKCVWIDVFVIFIGLIHRLLPNAVLCLVYLQIIAHFFCLLTGYSWC